MQSKPTGSSSSFELLTRRRPLERARLPRRSETCGRRLQIHSGREHASSYSRRRGGTGFLYDVAQPAVGGVGILAGVPEERHG